MEKIHVYIDEFGNSHLNLEKSGTFSHFIYTAIVVKESDLASLKEVRNNISRRFFQDNVIKSSNIGNDEKGRLKRKSILEMLKKQKFIAVSLVIDKAELRGEGLKIKKIFYKYFQRIFVEKFADNFTSFEICADKIGDTDFQKELTEYVNKVGTSRDLFNPERYYRLADDKKEEILIQLADFLCGCIGKIFCVSHQQEDYQELSTILFDCLYVDFFPNTYKSYLASDKNNKDRQYDSKIPKIAIGGIIEFIEQNANNGDMTACVEIIKYLLFIFKIDPNKLVSTKQLIAVVKNKINKYDQDKLRQHIAFMRDKGLIIVSPQGTYGYKIPNGVRDMIMFYNRYLSSIMPMLRRINTSNELIMLKTINEVNIMQEASEFALLQKLINATIEDKIKK